MGRESFDVIVLGLRCAGAPSAMLLARKGWRILAVDRATFPSDTISTHLIHPPGVAALRRWGIADRVVATGCPAIDTYAFDFGPFELVGAPGTEAEPVAYAPRRTLLDAILVEAAREAGAEVREAFPVHELVIEDGRVAGIRSRGREGRTIEERARVVVGADGLRSLVARTVEPEQYDEREPLLAAYYSYWSDLPLEGRFQAWVIPHRGMAAWPTNDGLTLLIAGWPAPELEQRRGDIEGNYMSVVDLAPAFAERVRAARREERFRGMAVPGYFRRPYGPGWALVGDAGYNKDFITAQGISDAFRDAELCTNAIDDWLTGRRPFDEAMAEYQETRDAHVHAMYGFTAELASLEPPPAEVARLFAAAAGNRQAMDAFARVNAGVTSPTEFFSEENVGRILGGGKAP